MEEHTGGYTEIQTIKCPECGTIQEAEVIFCPLIHCGDYIHECEHCGYTIMESEWEEIKEK